MLNFEPLEKIANAVLYEGFFLYPYRKSSVKNQKRWHFGTIEPGGSMQTECLFEGNEQTAIEVRIRFLQQEIEREVKVSGFRPGCLPQSRPFAFPPIKGELVVACIAVSDSIFRLTIRTVNLSEGAAEER